MSRQRDFALALGSLVFLVLPSFAAAQSTAQSAAQAAAVSARAGHCQIVLTGSLAAKSKVVVQRDGDTRFNKNVSQNDLPKTIKLRDSIGTTTSLVVTVDGKPLTVVVQEANGTADGCDDIEDDGGEVFYATGYVGLSIDTFAAEDLQKYLNPDESGDARFHSNAGVDFEYRIFRKKSLALWVIGETLHNAKSTSLDCLETPKLEKCQEETGGQIPQPDQFLAILRNAGSAEASAAFRVHFLDLNKGSRSPAAVYFQAKLGFLTVADSDGDAAEFQTYSLGVLAMGGPFAGSYIDVGGGKSDVYRCKPAPCSNRNRFKVDGLLSMELPGTTMRPYLQMVVDADRGDGADSIQTFVGVDFDLRDLRGIFIR